MSAKCALAIRPIENATHRDWEWLINVNFWGVVYGTKYFLPAMSDEIVLQDVPLPYKTNATKNNGGT